MIMPPGRVELWPLARLRPYARNAKTHDADQVAKIAASMAEFGWTVPCLVAADGELIAGHGRVLAAAQLGLAEAPVIVLGHLTEAQRRAYRIADNKLTELGGWDEALLLEELRGLMAEDFDLGLIGIPEDELDALLHDADDRAPIDDDTADTIPEAPARSDHPPRRHLGAGRSSPDLRRCHRPGSGGAADGRGAGGASSPPRPMPSSATMARRRKKVGDWDALIQGVFSAAPVTADAQLLVNLGLVHRDGEWIPYWEGWVDWMRAQGWRRFGWYVWDQGTRPARRLERASGARRTSSSSTSTTSRGSRTRPWKASTRAKPLAAAGCAGADGTVHRKTGTGNAIQSHRIPDSVFRIMRHKGRAGRGRVAPGRLPRGAGRGGTGGLSPPPVPWCSEPFAAQAPS